jgi:hypothetical protein
MKTNYKISIALAAFLAFGTASAVPVTVNFTADNEVRSGGLCSDMSCLTGTFWGALGPTANLADWTRSDSITVDLAPGTYWFSWQVINFGTGGSRNPAGLLAEIIAPNASNASTGAWEYSPNRSAGSWAATTEYGANGANNIWTQVNRGRIAGISTNAAWIWSGNNFSANQDNSLWIRTSITITEPATLLLLGLALMGAGVARRRYRKLQ